MKTYHEYEAADIKIGEGMDPVHSFLLGQMFVIGLTGFKARPGDDPEDKMLPVLRLIADFLNSAQRAGISISKSELPSVYGETADR